MGPTCPCKVFWSTQKLRQLIHRDTVASVGVVMGRSLPFVDNNSAIKVFRQGLSLDEVCEVGHILWSRFHAVAYTLIAPHQVPPRIVSTWVSVCAWHQDRWEGGMVRWVSLRYVSVNLGLRLWLADSTQMLAEETSRAIQDMPWPTFLFAGCSRKSNVQTLRLCSTAMNSPSGTSLLEL